MYHMNANKNIEKKLELHKNDARSLEQTMEETREKKKKKKKHKQKQFYGHLPLISQIIQVRHVGCARLAKQGRTNKQRSFINFCS